MSPSPLSIKRCTKGGTPSRHWVVAALAVALIGIVGSAFAAGDQVTPLGKKSVQPHVNDVATPVGITVGATHAPGSPLAPVNDDCAGAITIPDGPYPVVSAAIDAADATPQGVDDPGLFACNAADGTDYTIWYSFTPSVTTLYTISTCAATGATGNTVLDTVIGVLSTSDGTCGGTLTSVGCNDSSSCASPGDESLVSLIMNAGQTYFIVAGHWIPDGPLGPGNTTYAIEIERSNAPSNDTCAGAIALPLNRVVDGTTAASNNDYQSPATAACYPGLPGTQNLTTAPGRDVVYTFTAPSADNYSVRYLVTNTDITLPSQNPVLYTSTSCPGGGGVVSCLKGTNRQTVRGLVFAGELPNPVHVANPTATGWNQNRGEEVDCIPLSSGEQIYIFFDDGGAGNGGGPFSIEVTKCVKEVEPNDTTATATPYSAATCGATEGAMSIAPPYHCVLGATPGALCQNNLAGTAPNPPLHCGGGTGLCWPDSVCEAGPNAGAACVPRCVGGPTPGAICTSIPQLAVNPANQCGSGGSCQANGGCGVCTSGTNTGQPCINNTNCGAGGICGVGICGRTTNEGDTDFWSVGTPANGSKVYAAIEGQGANHSDIRMRITSTTETLGFDDDDGHSVNGLFGPTISGAKTTGTETFVKISGTTNYVVDNYRLYAVVQPPIAAAQPEGTSSDDGEGFEHNFNWPGDAFFQEQLNNGANTGYIRGQFSVFNDTDCYTTLAYEGDDLTWFGDPNPDRLNGVGVNSNAQVIPYSPLGGGFENFVFGTGLGRNIGPFTGNTGLNATTPQSTSFFQHWRAKYTGLFELCFYGFSLTSTGGGTTNSSGFPLAYAGSLSANCGPMHPAGPGTTTTDVAITKTGPSGSLATSTVFEYVVTMTNVGSDIAQMVTLNDVLPAQTVFLGVTVEDGFGGNNSACLSLPSPGTIDAPVNCTTASLAPGASATWTITAQVAPCLAGGITVENTVTVSGDHIDPNPANDSATTSFLTEENNQCSDLFCDSSSCIPNSCTINDRCENQQCVADPLDCDDHSLCTNEICDPASGCVYDPQPGLDCDDGNLCTGVPGTGQDSCDPDTGCVFAPGPAGGACNDFFNCTNNDQCDGFGNCAGHNVCDDNNQCTDDFADEFNNCECGNFAAPGLPCNDGDACTEGEVCDENAACGGGGPANCDDGDPCTDDSCDSQTGCAHTPTVCDDGNVCTIDSCEAGTGCVYTDNSGACNDGNGCTDDSCDPLNGCQYVNNTASCDDGNACTNGDVCGGGSCLAGAPTVCSASDQCHVAGVCDTGTGLCSDPAAPDGTACDDGNPSTSGDACQAGDCVGGETCPSSPDPKSKGYYKKLCGNGNHSGDSLTDADAACVAGSTATFSGISTVADICAVLAPGGGNQCAKEEDQLMVLALNLCRNRVCGSQEIDSNCGSNSKSIGESFAEMDAIFANPNRQSTQCNHGGCLGEEINTGRALKLNSLSLVREAETGKVRLSWNAPILDDGTNTASSYTIWRRPLGSDEVFQKIGATTGLTFLDENSSATSQFEYEILTVVP